MRVENRLRSFMTARGKMIAEGMARIRNNGKSSEGFGNDAKNLARIWMAIIW